MTKSLWTYQRTFFPRASDSLTQSTGSPFSYATVCATPARTLKITAACYKASKPGVSLSRVSRSTPRPRRVTKTKKTKHWASSLHGALVNILETYQLLEQGRQVVLLDKTDPPPKLVFFRVDRSHVAFPPVREFLACIVVNEWRRNHAHLFRWNVFVRQFCWRLLVSTTKQASCLLKNNLPSCYSLPL